MRIFDLPQELYYQQQQLLQQEQPDADDDGDGDGGSTAGPGPGSLAAAAAAAASAAGGGGDTLPVGLRVQESEAIYDYCWFSAMSGADPVSCCFATTCRVRDGPGCSGVCKVVPFCSEVLDACALLLPRRR